LGGPIGDGRQWQSTIDLDDLLAVILHAIHDERLQGPVNAVGLEPLRQRTLAGCLGAVLDRPSVLRLPATLIRGLLGDMGEEMLLFSQRVVPRRLQECGFRWDFPRVEDSLRHQLGRTEEDALRRAIEGFAQSAHTPA
ncbi:MAG: DUF1731 domain-containing protein, partial [Myxococcales bacterium]|nr:DUF1731 domain-containing protein [Myxococcales bacterium]